MPAPPSASAKISDRGSHTGSEPCSEPCAKRGRQTTDWLERSEWQLQRGKGNGTFGLWVEFSGSAGLIAVICDRSQWMLNVALQDWKHPIDLSIIADAISGQV